MALGLRALAQARSLRFLAYLLTLTFEEAREVAKLAADREPSEEGRLAP